VQTPLIANDETKRLGLGGMRYNRWEEIVNQLAQMGKIKGQLKSAQGADRERLERELTELELGAELVDEPGAERPARGAQRVGRSPHRRLVAAGESVGHGDVSTFELVQVGADDRTDGGE
jgi:hypothetical protein